MIDSAQIATPSDRCQRCGETHTAIEWQALTNPIIDIDGNWTHWAPCPTNGEPILHRESIDDRWPINTIALCGTEYDGERWHFMEPARLVEALDLNLEPTQGYRTDDEDESTWTMFNLKDAAA